MMAAASAGILPFEDCELSRPDILTTNGQLSGFITRPYDAQPLCSRQPEQLLLWNSIRWLAKSFTLRSTNFSSTKSAKTGEKNKRLKKLGRNAMANIIRRQDHWKRYSAPPSLLLQYKEPSWEFRELEYAPGGSWDHVTTRLHITSHIDPIHHRIGSPRKPFLIVPPSAAVSAPGDHLAGSWQGVGRGRHILVSPGFVTATIGKDLSPGAIARRHFARLREPDHSDTIIQHLMSVLASGIRNSNPGGSVFLQTVVTALVHYTLEITAGVRTTVTKKRGGLSSMQLRLVLDLIDARLTGRLSLLELAALLDVSTRYFSRAFRISTGVSPHQYILRRRVELARGLIKAGHMSLSEVAIAAGFVDHAQMTATFRKVMNLTPSHFRQGAWPTG
jgi:AraC-like DNA-binding protein